MFGDEAFGITVDTSSNAYIVGTTTSADFPTAGHTISSCTTDTAGIAFVSVINTTTPALTYLNLFGRRDYRNPGSGHHAGPCGDRLRHGSNDLDRFSGNREFHSGSGGLRRRQRRGIRLAPEHHQHHAESVFDPVGREQRRHRPMASPPIPRAMRTLVALRAQPIFRSHLAR